MPHLTGEESPPPTNPLYTVSQQVTIDGQFGREQKEDKRLKPCWSQVLQIDSAPVHPDQSLHVFFFVVMNNIL